MHRASRKKRPLNPNKSQLLFVEAPVNGPKHDCGPQLRSAVHPRTFESERQHRGDASWVSPQFTLQDIKSVSRERGKNCSATRRKSNTATGLSLHHNSRTAVCNYNPLSFETNPAVSQHRHNNLQINTAVQDMRCLRGKMNERPVSTENPGNKKIVETPKRTPSLPKGAKRSTATSVVRSVASRHSEISNIPHLHKNKKKTSEDLVHTPASKGCQTPNTTSVPTPPVVETPEVIHHCNTYSPSGLHLFPPNQAKTPPQTQNTSVLVMDTPEKDYGLRVTWRRRKELMKLLIDRGQLLQTDAEVADEWIKDLN